jgi:serine protease Do/serine protease DegQ
MNQRTVLIPAAVAVFAFAFGLATDARAVTTTTPLVKMPELKKDFSALSDGPQFRVSSYADIVEPVQKAVVSIESTKILHERIQANPLLRQFFGDIPDQDRESKEMGLGSGVIVSSDGFILTNNHVVENADELTVELADGRKLPAKVVGADPKTDIAVVKIDSTGLPAVTFADSDKIRVGDIVFAVGNPLGVGETVTMGIVSAKSRNVHILDDVAGYEDFIQTDAAINMGNSGGALLDARGRLIGINSAIVSPSRGNIGIGFAVPVDLAASVMKSLIETGTVARGFLGVGAVQITPDVAEEVGLPKDTKGVIVIDTQADSPAEKVGIHRRDVILRVNGKGIENYDELRLTISQLAPGSKVVLDISRDGKPMTVNVTLAQFAEKPNEILEGVEVGKLTDEVRRRLGLDTRITGLVVTNVDDKSDYAQDLPVGSVIAEINRTPVDDLAGAKAALRSGRNLLLVYSQGRAEYVVVSKHPDGSR